MPTRLLLLTAFACGIASEADAKPVVHGPQTRVHIVKDDISLSPSAQTAFAEFQQQSGYFGAFAYNANANIVAEYWGMTTFNDAAKVTLGLCDLYAQGLGGTCSLYAVAIPNEFAVADADTEVVPVWAQPDYLRYLDDREQPGFAAFALSAFGDSGAGIGKDSAGAAEQAASDECHAKLAARLKNFSSQERELLASIQADLCNMVETNQN